MGTRCDIYIEDEDEFFIGVQCFYDGYPEHMLKELQYCSFNMLKEYIIVAGSRGGFRLFYPSKGESEFIGSTPNYIYTPQLRTTKSPTFIDNLYLSFRPMYYAFFTRHCVPAGRKHVGFNYHSNDLISVE